MKQPALCITKTALQAILDQLGITFRHDHLQLLTPFLAGEFVSAMSAAFNDTAYVSREVCDGKGYDGHWMQLLPYIVITNNAGATAGYRRPSKNSEDRLAGNYSIGLGGHVEPADWRDEPVETWTRAAVRELNEELDTEGCLYSADDLGLPTALIWDSTPVGSVHLGIVYRVAVPVNDDTETEVTLTAGDPDEVLDFGFRTLDAHLASPRPENWTRLLLRVADKLRSPD